MSTDDTRRDGVTDAELVLYMSDELDGAARARIDAQLAAVPESAARLAQLERRATRLSDMLSATDPHATETMRSAEAVRALLAKQPEATAAGSVWQRAPMSLRAAAVILVLLGGIVLVEPARARIVELARDLAQAVGITFTHAPEPNAFDATASEGAAVRVAFDWNDATFAITVDAAAGTLIVHRGPAGRVSIEAADVPGADVVALPDGVRIEGAGDTDATYTVTLPPSVTTLRVRSPAGESVYALPPDGALRLPLAR